MLKDKINAYLNKRCLRKIKKHIYKKLKKVYGRRGAKVYSQIIEIIYKNIATRYNLTVKQVWDCLPLKVIPKKSLDGAYGVNFIKRGINYSGIKISKTATYNTFIHEFGHYLKKLICYIYSFYIPNNVILSDVQRMNIFVGDATKAPRGSINLFTWNVDQEETFAYSWERYVLNVNPRVYPEIFDEMKKHLMNDINRRSVNEVEHAYGLIETTDDIIDLFDNFIKTTKKAGTKPILSPASTIIRKQRKINTIKKIALISTISFIILVLFTCFNKEIIYYLNSTYYYLLGNRLFNNIINFFLLILWKIKLIFM